MKYVFLAFKTIAAGLIVLGIAVTIYVVKGINENLDRKGEEAKIINEYKEESFNNLCDFVENNLDELLEFSDNYISMLSPENTVGNAIYIEAEGDMQEFRDKLFDNVYEGYAFIDVNGEKNVVYRSVKGGFIEHIVIYEKENSIFSEGMSELPMEKDFRNRVFVYSSLDEHWY